MPKPLLMIKAGMVSLTKKKTKKKVVKKKAKKIELPVRPSPFKVGDQVWVQNGSDLVKDEVTKHTPPRKSYGEIQWHYSTKKSPGDLTESDLYPESIFTMIATDAVRMREAPLMRVLNNTFDAKAKIFAVYREKQKKPWAYYVIPDEDLLFETKTHQFAPYGNNSYINEVVTKIYKTSADKVELKLLPISSAPQEILTYLGLHVYSRKWIRHGQGA